MNKAETFQQFLTTQNTQVRVIDFIINLVLAAILSYILGRIYVKNGSSLSNRKVFANNFMIISLTTMFIITVVKSSLALSLGLVGALSVIRFRTAIKEPEELAYLFLSISLGLGLGAGQRLISIIAFLGICSLILLREKYKRHDDYKNLYLTISCQDASGISIEQIAAILKKYCTFADVKRYDRSNKILESLFHVEVSEFGKLQKIEDELNSICKSVSLTFLDNRQDL
ncbi:MAG: DUF4956 domain-containing protein [Candidatus Pacebacteria bacterium]|nr:DUF4956 domain-containing protein [Candidatus Paceibacterota bacterium]